MQADEGMWTFDNFPSKTVAAKYGFSPSQAWLDHVRLSSLRIAGGCSASFISPQGLVMTNHHCVVECVEQISTPEQNSVESRLRCENARRGTASVPHFELDQLVEIRDVTKDVQGAIAGKTGDDANKALNAKRAELQQRCGSDPSVRCDLVSLYHGGVYDLYRYKRYNDVRLVFAPEFAVGAVRRRSGQFQFPALRFRYRSGSRLRGGKPAATPDYLHVERERIEGWRFGICSGNPGGTSRQLTMSQMAFERDTYFPARNAVPGGVSRSTGRVRQLSGPEQAREAKEELFFVENSFKAYFGRTAGADGSAVLWRPR